MRIEGFKVCIACHIEKSTEEFHLNKNSSFGVKNKCKCCVSIERKADYYKNQNRNIQYSRDYYDKYPQDKEKLKIYRESHKEERNKRHKNRRNKDIFYYLNVSIRGLIKGSFKKRKTNKQWKKNKKSFDILGCSIEDFKHYLESKFEPWMNWDNYGNPKDGIFEPNKTWDLDHIIPISLAKTEEEVYKLNHYTNFQPLCSYTNRWIKKNKLI